jgi:itaconate CoA-transferase
VFGGLSAAEIISRLDSAQIAHARMNSVGDLLEHPQLLVRDCWREVGSPAGSIHTMLPPVRMDGIEPAMRAIPTLGEHSDTILEELGFDRRTIAAWRQEGAI